MLKRASLARAIALDPELLFLDEPTSGLDPASSAGVDELIRRTHALFGPTIVIVSHDLDLLWQVCDRVAVLGDGRVLATGHDGRLSRIDHPIVRAYFADPRAAQGARAAPRPRIRRNMDDKVNYALVGAFVLVLGARWWPPCCGWPPGSGSKRDEPYQAVIQESVAGLNVDAPVKYLGVDVGKVDRIELDPENSRQVRLLFLIEHGTPIKQDSEAVLKTQGLTGIAYVELSGGSVDSPPLRGRGRRRVADDPLPSPR